MRCMTTRLNALSSIAVLGISVALLATACGGGNPAKSEVASLGSTAGSSPATAAANTQDALLAYAACMRENGVDMADPTFDADGNPTGGGFGAGSGIDPRSDAFQTAQTACGDLLQGVTLGGGNAPDFSALQTSLSDYTACLRDQGLQVDDITLGGGANGNGPPPVGSSRPVVAVSVALQRVAAFLPAVRVVLVSIRPIGSSSNSVLTRAIQRSAPRSTPVHRY